ncbi:uncharacterized protein LOC122399852 [Colletes gigas]|uniref:uncharacterized protein LOC122399852 n=1 Tax=Colletes gigas TaxID=935657 RepID=UPI001C9AE5CC|nr:uncharacterized protein LOC122399852 [Colletes gigas]
MNRERKNETDKLLSNFFFGCNIPFSVVESSHFKAFVHALNKDYVFPSRKTMGTKLLNVQYEQLCSSIKQNVQQNAVLLIDGWKNSAANSKNVVAMLRLTTGRNLFLESWTFNQIRETGKALSEVVNQCVEIAYNQYNINIYAVVTDNASNMINIKRRVDLWHVTCNSHSGNLLFKSLIDTSFDDKVNNIIKDFRSPNLESIRRTNKFPRFVKRWPNQKVMEKLSDVKRNIPSFVIRQHHNLKVLVIPYQHHVIFFLQKCQVLCRISIICGNF